MAARTQKWQWIQHGLEAPGAADKIRLYDAYLQKMERALASSEWLVGERFSMADVAMAPYVNRLAALSMTPAVAKRPSAARRALVRAGVGAAHVPAGVRRVASRRARRRDAHERRAILARDCRAARDRNVIAAGSARASAAGYRRFAMRIGLAGLLRAGVLHELDVRRVEPSFRHHQRLREGHGIREREREL